MLEIRLQENCRKPPQDHLNTHTRIEPYECQHCHKKFTGRYRRNEHEKVCNGSVKLICHDSLAKSSALMLEIRVQQIVENLRLYTVKSIILMVEQISVSTSFCA
jgi:hypothetical protein